MHGKKTGPIQSHTGERKENAYPKSGHNSSHCIPSYTFRYLPYRCCASGVSTAATKAQSSASCWHMVFTNAALVTRVSPTHQSAASHFVQVYHKNSPLRRKQGKTMSQTRAVLKRKRKAKKKNTDQKQRVNFIKAKPQIMKNLPFRQ